MHARDVGPQESTMEIKPDNEEIKPTIAELKALFGPPPVLSSESEDHYYEILLRFMSCLKPRNHLERSLVKDIADATWEIKRYSRYKTLTVERKFRERVA